MMVTLWQAAAILVTLGLLLALLGQGIRSSRGLGGGRTVSLDRVTLTSSRLGLTGRPDRLIKTGGTIIVEEWKSARQLRQLHRAQLGVYFLLIEEQFRQRPAYGVIVCDGARHRIENTDELRAWVMELAGRIRAARADVKQPIEVHPRSGQCQACGMRSRCAQARL